MEHKIFWPKSSNGKVSTKTWFGKNVFTWQLFDDTVGSYPFSTPPLGQIYNR